MAVRHEGPGHLHTAGPHAPTRASTRGHDIFRPPAFRFSVIRYPPRSWALLAVGLPDLGPDLGGVTTFRTCELQPGWVPSLPRGRRCSSRPSRFLDRRLPLYRGQSLDPAPASHRAGLCMTRHQREFKQFTRPTFPSPVAARMERAALGLSPGLRTPPTRSRRRTPRWGQAIKHGPGTTRSTSHRVDPPIV